MSRFAVLLAEGFEEIEFCTITDILRRADLEVKIVGLKNDLTGGSRGIRIMPDMHIDDLKTTDYEVLVLPGGNPGFINMGKDQRVLELIRTAHAENKYMAAICAGPAVLSRAGVIDGKEVAIYPGVKHLLKNCTACDLRVKVEGRLITGRSPQAAMDFALTLMDMFAKPQSAKVVRDEMLV
ncbi:DJ-1 family glyoxalase III [Dehalococcoides mccartyi]|jgi:4-methyl-5(b-hydroxyethyl)-thiazole monophosphate biosynthesis|uniref:4-methyl-5(B-hydroxyethyl)-thiazole monophosphate biosynthesis protein n=1 Tax=Dehalococcoides mccartyi TaxID=61435 RepID=A0A142V7X4_9CHLR|nr:DJ-1 family glyoxalase III [Dehalococcoides mccartyi]AII60340.1 glutamine amidotransferase [Dehalococcoides mccartyi CG5]AMU85913.1 4-methyl-5(b-hydroxyethyl)-thiazole monophosphate biosynthesis protein [Dehalococcoides mccartyi]AOV98787.1 chaperone [Dehalococcoides mccartyi]MBA2084544.1 Intracellular protease [Dehalococcoides mccartyi]QBX63272.1 DJ-1/PfpI family protein [Dehalococcoides mccartyi]